MLDRLRVIAFELWMIVYMLVHTKVHFRLRRMRKAGQEAEADALVEEMVIEWANWVFRNLRCRLDVEGAEHVPRGEAFVVYSNHQSKYDIPALLVAMHSVIGFVTKRELFWIPGLTYWMRRIGCIAFDRKDVTSGGEALHALAADLRHRRRGFIIFPEGTRTRDPERRVQPFRRGAVRLASQEDLPVLPVVIDGTRLLDLPPAMAATRGGGRFLRVRILPLRRVENNSAPARKQFMDDLYETLRSNWEAIRVEWPAP